MPSKSKRNLYYANANIISTAVDGPYMGDAETRWDYLWYLRDSPGDGAMNPGGQVIRGKAL